MHECNAMQILETKKTKTKEQWSQKVEQRSTMTISERLNLIEPFASKTF